MASATAVETMDARLSVGLYKLYAREHLELEVDWSGKPGELVAALLYCRWLDQDGDYILHDWVLAPAVRVERTSTALLELTRAAARRLGCVCFSGHAATRGSPLSENPIRLRGPERLRAFRRPQTAQLHVRQRQVAMGFGGKQNAIDK